MQPYTRQACHLLDIFRLFTSPHCRVQLWVRGVHGPRRHGRRLRWAQRHAHGRAHADRAPRDGGNPYNPTVWAPACCRRLWRSGCMPAACRREHSRQLQSRPLATSCLAADSGWITCLVLLQHNRDANQPTNMGIQPAAAPAMPPMIPEAPPSRIIRCLFTLLKTMRVSCSNAQLYLFRSLGCRPCNTLQFGTRCHPELKQQHLLVPYSIGGCSLSSCSWPEAILGCCRACHKCTGRGSTPAGCLS